MNREDLVSLCECFARRRHGVVSGRVRVEVVEEGIEDMVDPVPEILRSFRRAEISESEKNALMSLVSDPDEDSDLGGEAACIHDPFADEQPVAADED